MKKDKIKSIIEKAYVNFDSKDVVKLNKINGVNLLELYHGPTLAFKDIAMQVIGLIFDEIDLNKKKK